MKYLIKSNLLVIASAFVFPFIYFTMAFDEYSYIQTLLIIIAIFEAILVKLNYDFINYDHDINIIFIVYLNGFFTELIFYVILLL